MRTIIYELIIDQGRERKRGAAIQPSIIMYNIVQEIQIMNMNDMVYNHQYDKQWSLFNTVSFEFTKP